MNQVVVLCGGQGKRLKPLTNKIQTNGRYSRQTFFAVFSQSI